MPILPIPSQHLIKNDTIGIDISWFLRFEDHIVFVSKMFNGCVHALVGVACDQRQIFFHRMKATTVQNHFLLLNKNMRGFQAAMHYLTIMKFDDRLPQFDGQLNHFVLVIDLVDGLVKRLVIVLFN